MLRGLVGDEKRSKGGHRDHDHCNGSFDLEPEYSPRRINLTMVDVATSYLNYCGDHREDTETQDPPKCKLSPQANLDIPEQDYRNGDDCYTVNYRSKVFLWTWILRKASVHTSKTVFALRIPFSRASAPGVTHSTAGNQ